MVGAGVGWREAHRIKGNLKTQAQKQPGNVNAVGEIGSSNF